MYLISPLLAKIKQHIIAVTAFIIATLFLSCKKFVTIDAPVNTLTTGDVFTSDASATSSVVSIYSNMVNGPGFGFSNGIASIYCGVAGDELIPFQKNMIVNSEFWNNQLSVDNSYVAIFWSQPYSFIYRTNACLEGIQSSKYLTDPVKKQLIGECMFLRAFFYFYLVNLFGDVPLITTTKWQDVSLFERTNSTKVYEQIINDLIEAKKLLADDFSFSYGERVRATKWSATALLARVYLYIQNWQQAEHESNELISEQALFSLKTDHDEVFLMNSEEAIFQLEKNNSVTPFNALHEQNRIYPFAALNRNPSFYVTPELLNSFESGDLRMEKWINTTKYQGITYYFPYKYKHGLGKSGEPVTEYYMVFRLAEQYLIRAEARARQGNLTDALTDLNVLRVRSLLPELPVDLTQQETFNAIMHERRNELFVEWGHRWLDLKRWDIIDSVLSSIKGNNWQSTDKLFPIPRTEIQKDPNLMQNPGY